MTRFVRHPFHPENIHPISNAALDMYLDGQPVGETSLQGMEQTIASTLRFGRLNEDPESPNARQFLGRLAELAIYERALSAEEIRNHAQQ